MSYFRTLRNFAFLAVCSATLLIGCSDHSPGVPPEPMDGEGVEEVGQVSAPIINGQLDSTHDAVVAVLSNNGSCSGTIIHVSGSYGYVLSAAHCGAPKQVVMGTDYNSLGAKKFQVVDYLKHPQYNKVMLDFMMVKFVGADSSTPVIPAMPPGSDKLVAGTAVTHVGFGKAGPAPGSNNTKRRQIAGTLFDVTPFLLEYKMTNGGPCSGDSGGPQLVSGPEIVAGVTSFGSDAGCQAEGFSGRVSVVHDTFIQPFISGGATKPLTCDQCRQVATSGEGACRYKVDACLNDSLCGPLVDCLNSCQTVFCQDICVDDHSGGVDVYNEIVDCVCQSGCAGECSGDDYCTNGKLKKPGDMTTSSSVGSGGTSSSSVVGATVGAGATSGSSGSGSGWIAPGETDEDYEGVILTSCAARPLTGSDEPGRGFGGFLLAIALGWTARRRRVA